MDNQILRVALAQQTCQSSVSENLQQIAQAAQQAQEAGVQLLVLQELHNTPYFCQTEDPKVFDLAETIPGPSTEYIAALAKQHQLVIVASLFEKRAAGLYHNTAVVFEKDGQIAGQYRKMHIPDDPGYYEKYYFTPGDLGFEPIETSVGKLGVLVCWDQWFPEAARLMALKGAEVLIYPTAIGWDAADSQAEQQVQLDTWVTSQRAHAIANGLPVLACNRVGQESAADNSSGQQFWGNSFVADAAGQIIEQASHESPQLLIAELDRQHSEQRRRIWPFLRDRRIDAYSGLLSRFLD